MELSHWQTQMSTVRERTQYAFKKSLFCDVLFSVADSVNGGKVTIPANKYMLAVSSPVFESMFYGNLKEKKDVIDLQDCTKQGLQELLRFVHCDEVHLTGNNVMEVLYIAGKYIMPFLAIKCREYLQEHLKPEEVFTVLPQVQKLSDKKLEKLCWHIIDNETQLAISSEPFLEISQKMLCEVLTRDSLKIKELEIFRAVDKWAEKKAEPEQEGLKGIGKSKRAVLGEDVIKLIRFPLMSQEEIAEVVLPSDILKKRELSELFQIFCKVPPSTGMFCTKSRRIPKEELYLPNRFRSIPPNHGAYYANNCIDAIDFAVSKAVSLSGVQLIGFEGSTYNVVLEILKNDNVLSRISSSYVSELMNGKYYGFNAELDKPVSLDPKVWYTVKATIKGPPSCSGQHGQTSVSISDNVKITYRNSRKCTNYTGVNEGQFPSLLLLS